MSNSVVRQKERRRLAGFSRKPLKRSSPPELPLARAPDGKRGSRWDQTGSVEFPSASTTPASGVSKWMRSSSLPSKQNAIFDSPAMLTIEKCLGHQGFPGSIEAEVGHR